MRENIHKHNKQKQAVPVLFTVLLTFALCFCALFTILIGAQVYENIAEREARNFSSGVALSYISNKIKQADERGMISVELRDNTDVLNLRSEIDGNIYENLVYCKDGKLMEIFAAEDSGIPLEEGVEILPLEGLLICAVSENLIEVSTLGENTQTLFLALRSESGGQEGEYEQE